MYEIRIRFMVAAGRVSRRSAAGSLLLLMALLAVTATASAVPDMGAGNGELPTIVGLVTAGQFREASSRIDAALQQPGVPAATLEALEFQRARMQRMREDFNLTADDVEARVRKQIPDLTDAEFEGWDAQGLFEHMYIDGNRMYFDRSPSNLFHLSAEARARSRVPMPFADSGLSQQFTEQITDYDGNVIRRARATGRSSVLPQRVRVTQSVTVDADAVAAGKTIRAWIPYPRYIPGQQEEIRLVASQPSGHRIAPRSALQRTVYLEEIARARQPTVFSVTYEVTLYAQYHAIDPNRVVSAKITPELAPYVAERAPHIVFTEPLRVFSRQVVGDATNPYRIAQKIFAAVDAIPWAGAREYSTIPDLSEYTLHAGHGDCGEQTMLLIALMRMNGIPARWQSGWFFSRGGDNDIHDWAQIYLAPYGWVPIDVTYGRLESGDPSLKWFYLGGLDNFRIAFNDDFSQAFAPPKHSFRSDDVDSQRGEVESDDNLYYDKWSYHFDWKILRGVALGHE
ncbi:MAG TPA: transglutaminase-like domain-containing protein [Steroidobacteraceae bacterium]|nr:transglutaminase-like domain-containing protein [Steroidobacteraceae bacterium]